MDPSFKNLSKNRFQLDDFVQFSIFKLRKTFHQLSHATSSEAPMRTCWSGSAIWWNGKHERPKSAVFPVLVYTSTVLASENIKRFTHAIEPAPRQS